jgi:hypothetical protein
MIVKIHTSNYQLPPQRFIHAAEAGARNRPNGRKKRTRRETRGLDLK